MSNRILQNSVNRLLESGDTLVLEDNMSSPANVLYPMSPYFWNDRIGVTKPDVYGPTNLSTLSIPPTGTGGYGNLIVTADSTIEQTIGIAIVLWDNRGNPISVGSGMITLSSWAKNSLGNLISADRYGISSPGFMSADVSMADGYTVLLQSTSVSNVPALGTVATTLGSTAVVGTKTGFSGTVNSMVGSHVVFSGDPTSTPYQIASVTDSFDLTLSSSATWAGSGQVMTFVNPVNLHWRLF